MKVLDEVTLALIFETRELQTTNFVYLKKV